MGIMAKLYTDLSNKSLELGRRLTIPHSAARQLTTGWRGTHAFQVSGPPRLRGPTSHSAAHGRGGEKERGAALQVSLQVRETGQGLITETSFALSTHVMSMLK